MAFDLLTPLSQGLAIRGQLDERQANRDLRAQQQEQFDAQQAQQAQRAGLIQGAVTGGLGSQEYKNLLAFSLDDADKLKGLLQTDDQGLDAAFEDGKVFKHLLQIDPTGQQALQFGVNRLQAGKQQGRNMMHTERLLQEIQANPENALTSINSFLSIGDKPKGEGLASAKTKVYDNGTIITQLPDRTTQVTNPEGDVVTGDARIAALKTARKEQVGFTKDKAKATAEGKIEGETSRAHLVIDTKVKMAEAVALAKIDAKGRGETLSDLAIAQASLPGLVGVVNELKALAPLVTSTMGGRGFDLVSKELGFGSTKGANAKAAFKAIVNNQILPLLKQTFGAAFTKEEGAELKATMGDVDSSPSEKMLQLDAFIDGKVREIQTSERLLGQSPTKTETLLQQPAQPKQGGVLHVDANGNKAMVFPDGSFEEVQ